MAVVLLCSSCSSDPVLDDDRLSSLLSVSSVTKTRIQDSANPELVAGVIVDTSVIHTGFVTIDVPFRLTWMIRREGAGLASATRDFEAGFRPGESLPVRLTLRFDPLPSLDGTSDAVTFDILGDPSNTILGG